MFIIKAAKYMSRDCVTQALEQMFVRGGEPFSISIHNSRGRYWLEPTDVPHNMEIKHNKHINWKPYRG